jgi:mRNA interferase MazF
LLSSGDIVVADFPGVQGLKRRPAIVVSSDDYHQSRPDVILGLITSQVPSSPGQTDHLLGDWRAAGLRKPSLFRAYFVTLPRTAISSTIGRPTTQYWQAILACVRRAIAS